MKILITGGTGVIGIALTSALAKYENNQIYISSRRNRISGINNIVFLHGNAHDIQFLQSLDDDYDAVVDLMNYGMDEAKTCIDVLSKKTKKYYFISSCRVFANKNTIVESSPMLIDVTEDDQYRKTNDYALSKAREEQLIKDYHNAIVLRPYITYGPERLQLSIYEKELWLWRAIKGHTIVVTDEMLNATTTITYSVDVSEAIARIVMHGTEERSINIITNETKKWIEIYNIYRNFLSSQNIDLKLMRIGSDALIQKAFHSNKWQLLYDRKWDRVFDNSVLLRETGMSDKDFTKVDDGLRKSLDDFSNNIEFKTINPIANGYMDRITHEKGLSKYFTGISKIKYLFVRYCPLPLSLILALLNCILYGKQEISKGNR